MSCLQPVSRPLSMSRSGPPPDHVMTKLQQGKILWVGSEASAPEAKWPDGKPEVDKIKAVLAPCLSELNSHPIGDYEVEFLAAGAWNKVFLIVNKDGGEFVFRVALSAYPWYKTEAEVATIQFIHQNTDIPAPEVHAYDSSMDNELGYEWILMERLPGVTYRSVGNSLGSEQRLAVARTVVEWTDQLSRHRFGLIGSFYLNHHDDGLHIGRPVIKSFMGDWRHEYHHRRGPFNNVHSYIQSLIDCLGTELHDHRQRLRSVIDIVHRKILILRFRLKDTPYHIDEADAVFITERLKQLENKYSALLASADVKENAGVSFEAFRHRLVSPDNFPRNEFVIRSKQLARLSELVDTVHAEPLGPQDAILHHWDISEDNVLIDPDSFRVTGLVDWEQLYPMPLILVRSRYPPIIGRNDGSPDYKEEPVPLLVAKKRQEKHHPVGDWGKQLMREEFDRRLRELDSPWLATGKDSKNEAGGLDLYDTWDDNRRCEKCRRFHWVTAESRLIDSSDLAHSDVYCEGILDDLEELDRATKRQKHHKLLSNSCALPHVAADAIEE